ncbi:MAG: spore maturation protein [Firmicutes bacterium]|nr:spore maturation protein [Bacillota bacterium]
MMNCIWAVILLSSIIYAFFSGNIDALETAFSESSTKAVEFLISLCGIMAMWSGLMEIAEKTGLIEKLAKGLMPLTKLLFPKQKNPETLSLIVMSFMSNLFGAGNSSTVFALKTMENLDKQNKYNTKASNDMCTFAVVNMAIAPIVPILTIQIRSEVGSSNPYSTVVPSLVTALITILVSIIICKYFERKEK